MVSIYSVSGILFQQHQWFKTVSMSSFGKCAKECQNGVLNWEVYNHKVRDYLALCFYIALFQAWSTVTRKSVPDSRDDPMIERVTKAQGDNNVLKWHAC